MIGLLLVTFGVFAHTLGDGDLFVPIPETPGYPEAIAHAKGIVYVTGPATFGTAGGPPSVVWAFNLFSGELISSINIEGENLAEEHALSGITVDAQGRLYALSTQLGVVRIDPHRSWSFDWATWEWSVEHSFEQELYTSSPFPALGPVPSIPNDAIFGEDGVLYASDSTQGIIWTVPAGGGEPVLWYSHPSLQGQGPGQFGSNGIRFSPEREYLYIAYTGGPATIPELPDRDGVIYRILADGTGPLETVHTYESTDAPDGLSFSYHGDLYVALAGSNAISVLDLGDADGALSVSEIAHYETPPSSPIPFAQPSNMIFMGRYLFIVNHAVFEPANAGLFGVIGMYVGEFGDPLPRPLIP